MSKIKELQIRFKVATLPLSVQAYTKYLNNKRHTCMLYVLLEMKTQSLLPQDKRSRGLFMCRFRGRNGVT